MTTTAITAARYVADRLIAVALPAGTLTRRVGDSLAHAAGPISWDFSTVALRAGKNGEDVNVVEARVGDYIKFCTGATRVAPATAITLVPVKHGENGVNVAKPTSPALPAYMRRQWAVTVTDKAGNVVHVGSYDRKRDGLDAATVALAVLAWQSDVADMLAAYSDDVLEVAATMADGWAGDLADLLHAAADVMVPAATADEDDAACYSCDLCGSARGAGVVASGAVLCGTCEEPAVEPAEEAAAPAEPLAVVEDAEVPAVEMPAEPVRVASGRKLLADLAEGATVTIVKGRRVPHGVTGTVVVLVPSDYGTRVTVNVAGTEYTTNAANLVLAA